LALTYDVQLADTLAEFCAEDPLPAMWREFDALGGVPVLIIRRANSDVLSSFRRQR
jgi:hypothetical protein